jgi:hypothetical protein
MKAAPGRVVFSCSFIIIIIMVALDHSIMGLIIIIALDGTIIGLLIMVLLDCSIMGLIIIIALDGTIIGLIIMVALDHATFLLLSLSNSMCWSDYIVMGGNWCTESPSYCCTCSHFHGINSLRE